MAWKIVEDNNYASVHKNSGAITYGGNLCGGVPNKCQTFTNYSVQAKLEEGSNFDNFETAYGPITQNFVCKSCNQESLVMWFNGDDNRQIPYLFNPGEHPFDIKNVDECRHLVFSTALWSGSQNFDSSGYTDSGYPYIYDPETQKQKYKPDVKYAGHKIKYHTTGDTIPESFYGGDGTTSARTLVELYFPKYNNNEGTTIKTIGANAFANCHKLSAVTFNAVETIGEGAFSGCTSLEYIDWAHYVSNCTTNSQIKSIGASAFTYCNSISALTLPNNSEYTTITDSCFRLCASLETLVIPDNVTSIGNSAFQNCSSLTSVTFSSNVTNIGDLAFAFCFRLTSITVNRTTPPNLGNSAFTFTNCNIYVPSASVDDYKAADGWSTYASRIYPIPT